MSGKDITIPFGPDRTGGIELIPDPDAPRHDTSAPAAQDPFENIPAPIAFEEEAADNVRADGNAPASGASDAGAIAEDSALQTKRPSVKSQRDSEYSEQKAAAQGMDDVQMSFLALKNSIGQGRELKARGKERDEFLEKLDADKAELADREYILANYAAVIAEQDDLIARHTQQRDARKAESAQVAASKDETNEALERMRAYHASQMEPLERELGQARASADQAKNDERSRKSELSAAESEVRRAQDGQGKTLAEAQHAQVEASYEEARVRSETARQHLDEVQRVYDDARQQVEQAEGPLVRQLEDLGHQEDELKESIARLAEEISSATHRRQYCESVYRYPDETAKLRESVAADEDKMSQLDAEYSALDAQLTQSKAASKKAKAAIGVVIAIIVVFIIVWLIVGSR